MAADIYRGFTITFKDGRFEARKGVNILYGKSRVEIERNIDTIANVMDNMKRRNRG